MAKVVTTANRKRLASTPTTKSGTTPVDWSKRDANRIKPRVSIVLTADVHERGVALAQARVQTFSQLVEWLLLQEFAKTKAR